MGLMEKLRYLDPYYYFDRFWDKYVGIGGITKTLAELVYTLFLAYLIYFTAGLILHTPRPAVIVASSSMIPVYHPGDIVIVRGVSPNEINAPEVSLNIPYTDHVTPSQAGIRFLRHGIKLYAIEVNGKIVPLKKGTIIVYRDDLNNRDIIHRVILKIKTPHGYYFVTKGDNEQTNPTADQDCILGYCVYPFLVSQDQVIGTPIFVIPRIGIIKLILTPSSS